MSGWRKAASAALLAGYFFYFARDGLKAHWAADDMMNLYKAWHPGLGETLLAQLRLWRGEYRPMGGLFYAGLYEWFGMDPYPYRVAILLLLGFNVWLAYMFARRLGCGELPSTLAAAAVAYHAGLGCLHYNTDIIYDIVCFTFYFGAFIYYAGIRARNRLPGWIQTGGTLILFLCALNSKEMAVTLPVIVLAYEALYHRPRLAWKDLLRWAAGPARTPLLMGLLTAVYLYGKMFGPDPLIAMPAYRPVFSLDRLLVFQATVIRDLFFLSSLPKLAGVSAVWILLTVLAWSRKRPDLKLCWVILIVAPLPIEFLEGRYQAALYIPYMGWAVIAAVFLTELAFAVERLVSRKGPFAGAPQGAVAFIVIAAALIPWVRENRRLHETYIVPSMMGQAPLTREVLAEFDRVRPTVPPNSRVVFLKDPFEGGWDMLFIAGLKFRDRTIQIELQQQARLSGEELARIPYHFTYEKGLLTRVK